METLGLILFPMGLTFFVIGLILLNKGNKNLIIDTSVLMDGRILGIVESGIVEHKLVILKDVVNELQLLADGSDGVKRARARQGLDLIATLQKSGKVEVEILDITTKSPEVDSKLIEVAKKFKKNATLCSIDYNLLKVAEVEGIKTFNINELTKDLRSSYIPGEEYTVKLNSKGSESHQAVAHLKDGTMVVVENSSDRIGQEVKILITRSIQTDAGRMLFAKLVNEPKKYEAKNNENLKNKVAKPSGRSRRAENQKNNKNGKKQNFKNKKNIKENNHRKTQSEREDDLISLVNKQ